jgi:hypothetical protein
VPADHGCGFHEDQDVRPAGPTLAECRPEESVQGVQFWPWPFPFEDGDLLAKSENLEGGITSIKEEDSDSDKEGEDEIKHETHSLNMP